MEVEFRGTRMRAGVLGEEGFSPSPKVTVRWESFDAEESGRPDDSRSIFISDHVLEGAQLKSKIGSFHHGMPCQDLASSQNSTLAVNWL